jgi:hypothetical protein
VPLLRLNRHIYIDVLLGLDLDETVDWVLRRRDAEARSTGVKVGAGETLVTSADNLVVTQVADSGVVHSHVLLWGARRSRCRDRYWGGVGFGSSLLRLRASRRALFAVVDSVDNNLSRLLDVVELVERAVLLQGAPTDA